MTTSRMPALFLGHGSPINVLEENTYTQAWRELGATLPWPKGIIAVSAHWYTRGTAVTAMEKPRTIHDFGGFPQALFDTQYPAPGSPELAERIQLALAPLPVIADQEKGGFDHGSWGVLIKMYPQADIPVVQLSVDGTQSAEYHYLFLSVIQRRYLTANGLIQNNMWIKARQILGDQLAIFP